jgi:predicted HTH domain antitoxin
MPEKIHIDKEAIIQLYLRDNLKMHEVAQKLNVCPDTIRNNMRLYGIPPKSPEIYRKGQDNRIIAKLPRAKELYYENKTSFGEVCQILQMSFYALKRLFTENNLQLRSSGEAIRLAYSKHSKMGFKKGDGNPRFNGYKTHVDRTGYVRVYKPDHPKSGVNGYVFEHILAWEDAHGIPLPDDWTVHHLNGIKHDNRPENLAGMPSRAHRYILAEKAKRIRLLENKVRELGKTLLEASRMKIP